MGENFELLPGVEHDSLLSEYFIAMKFLKVAVFRQESGDYVPILPGEQAAGCID